MGPLSETKCRSVELSAFWHPEETLALPFIPKSQKFVFQVAMSCEGCSGAVNRVLKKLPGGPLSPKNTHPPDKNTDLFHPEVTDIAIDMVAQTVTVESSLPSEKLLEVISRTGKVCVVYMRWLLFLFLQILTTTYLHRRPSSSGSSR